MSQSASGSNMAANTNQSYADASAAVGGLSAEQALGQAQAQTQVHDNEQVITATRPTSAVRRHDVDWLRIYALCLLIVYHVVLSFQPWVSQIGFMQNAEPLEILMLPVAAFNLWRIPILFMVSGMGVYFAMQRRDWRALLKDRTLRIGVPLVFGYFCIAPICDIALRKHLGQPLEYEAGLWHLWFLFNIFCYVVLFLPLCIWYKKYLLDSARHNNWFRRSMYAVFKSPLAPLILSIPLAIEVEIMNPLFYAAYAQSWHGFWLGMICFVMGFLFVAHGKAFWPLVEQHRHIALVIALLLYVARVAYMVAFQSEIHWLAGVESMAWMMAVLGFGSIYLNKPSPRLRYFSDAAYPVYIWHLPVQFVLSYFLIPMAISPWVKLLVLLVGTFVISWVLVEYFVSRINWLRPLFGMKRLG